MQAKEAKQSKQDGAKSKHRRQKGKQKTSYKDRLVKQASKRTPQAHKRGKKEEKVEQRIARDREPERTCVYTGGPA